MTMWDLGALARAAGSEVCGGALPERIAAVGTDTRSLPSASLFVALRGERFDGHDFVAAAANMGAVCVMVDRRGAARAEGIGVPALVVEDTLVALGDMARSARRSLGHRVVAVTGSNGKTTTKEMIAAVLAERGPVHKTTGNLNNFIGMPLTILGWPEGTWAGVLEMGMSARGEIARLCEIAEPDVGVVTMVGPAHLEQLGTLENVARAKGELFERLPAGGTGVVNADDPLVGAVAVPLLGKRARVTFGRAAAADVRVVDAVPEGDGLRVRFSAFGAPLEARLPLSGPHNAMNAAAAVAVGHVLGIGSEAIARGLARLQVPGGRMRVVRRSDRPSYIDDTYNANPASMGAAFAALASVADGRRRVAVLGDMLELGPTSPALHREVGAAAARSGAAIVLALGEHAGSVAEGARGAGADGRGYDSLQHLLADLDGILDSSDFVLVKGSRGMRMERVVAHLEGRG